jgi:hypothetical protein
MAAFFAIAIGIVWTALCVIFWWFSLQLSIVYWKPGSAGPFWIAVARLPAFAIMYPLLKWVLPIMFLSLSLGFINAFLFLSIWYAGGSSP